MTATFIHPLTGFIEKTFVITEFELRKLRHDFTELITRALQPALWLLIFGQVFARSGAMHTGNIPYLDFIAPGILAQSVLFVAIFYGINVIWERDLGIVQKFLASPTPRAALVLGKGLSAGIRSLSQTVIVYGLSLLLGVKLNWSPLALLNVLIIVVLAATLFGRFRSSSRASSRRANASWASGRCSPCRCSLPATRFTHRHHARLAEDHFPS
jgi:ABC-2 type transport system permease protein